MPVIDALGLFFSNFFELAMHPGNVLLLFGSVIMGILFGATPGLTATLGVALLTTLTYGMNQGTAMIALLGIYVGGVYGGSYASILINIPGTAAAAATSLDGYPLAKAGKGGVDLGLTTTASAIGTFVGMLFVVSMSPLISALALQFTSFEFFLLAFFGILISGTLTSPDVTYKGWIAGFLGLFLAVIGRESLQFYARFTFGFSQLEGGIEVVPVLIGAFGIPQIIQVLKAKFIARDAAKFERILPEWRTIAKHSKHILRSALIGVGIAPVPMLRIDHPGFIEQITAILLMASIAMGVAGMLLAKQVVKVLRIPPSIFMPIIGVLCIIGSYALGTKVMNLYLMLPVGIICYFLTEMGYPIAPLVIGVILGPMADSNLRRALMISEGSFLPMFTRPVSLVLVLIIILLVLSQIPAFRRLMKGAKDKLFSKRKRENQS